MKVDIAVLGAGPAALSSAIILRQSGCCVTLIGQARDGMFGIGESLPGAVQRPFARLGLGPVERFLGSDNILPCTANLSKWGSADWEVQDSIRNPEGGGWHIDRKAFELRLLQFAERVGVDIRLGQVSELQDDGVDYRLIFQTAEGKATVDVPFVIDGTGRKAWFTRRWVGAPERQSHQFALVGWIASPANDVEDCTRIKAVSEGWWYTARLPRGVRVVGFHALPDTIQAYYSQPEEFLTALSGSGVLPDGSVMPELIAPLQTSDASVALSPKLAGRRWLAIGDAALSFDPLSAQGLYFALYSGIAGAEAAVSSLSDPEGAREILSDYCRKVAEVFHTNQRTRQLFYAQENRFPHSPYWQAQKGWESRLGQAI